MKLSEIISKSKMKVLQIETNPKLAESKFEIFRICTNYRTLLKTGILIYNMTSVFSVSDIK